MSGETHAAATQSVRTVLGDIAPGDLGACNAHDHLFLLSPCLPGEELDDVEAARAELDSFALAGGSAVAQWTPWGMGRRLSELPALSRATGVHLIAATGLHQAKHYRDERFPHGVEKLADLFVRELTRGPVRAGLIKVAAPFHRLDAHANRTMAAAARAHHATGAPIGVHLEGGTAALDTLDLLCGDHGVPAHRVILGHLLRYPDPAVHLRAAEAGAFLAFDGPSRAHHAVDWRLYECVAALADAGYADRVLLGGDTVVASARATADGPGMRHLLEGIRGRIAQEIGPDVAHAIFVTNPANAFAAHWRAPAAVVPDTGHAH
ncbi:phosphotriesterase [Streptomyces sp. NBC_00102]|uniref:phosphotriesterase family protein n=1 Tax=Streptomyces sp. NBC_00102 TaxID=2975652 RepID=UPI002257FB85|nr:phosphotriesterase [Streptomyces sp. NBC_00102]MCX5395444.1 phosphotriesterase [Streptomyces sp. NBC_00102]